MAEARDFSHFVRQRADGAAALDLILQDVDCAACFIDIENAVKTVAGLISARVNVTYNRIHLVFKPDQTSPTTLIDVLAAKGYRTKPFRINDAEQDDRARGQFLVRCLAVATFAAANIMLLSFSIWTGSEGDLSPQTRDFFHWLSALIALPAATYAGQPFFSHALNGLKQGRWNMDVPISLGIMLALGMSVFETIGHGEHAYFDSAVMLLTFLLLGRVMEQAMRRRTRAIAGNIAALKGEVAHRVLANGELMQLPVEALEVGDCVLVRAGERIPADGHIITGTSSVDESIITGETTPRPVAEQALVYAGSLNCEGTIQFTVAGVGQATLLDEISQLVEKAGAARSQYQRLADRAARLYAPMVHATAFITCCGWLIAGADLHKALVIAISVLIITCPCALALAVPAVQVAAAGRLFRKGLFLNSPEALERLAEINTVVFDKTGTLTRPAPVIINAAALDPDLRDIAARLARVSHHPLAQAVAQSLPTNVIINHAQEISGQGVEAKINGQICRLGSAAFCSIPSDQICLSDDYSVIYVRRGEQTGALYLSQSLRPDAIDVIAHLKALHLPIHILSGDHPAAVARIADQLALSSWQASLKPADKIAFLEQQQAQGHKILMVGDGLNDAPALAAAHASLSPISAVDMAQAQADVVFLGESLSPVVEAIIVARRARALMRQNLALAIIYNIIAVPLAIAGWVTPLIAAAAMSGSSVLVTVNALRIYNSGLGFKALLRPYTLRSAHAADADP
jgi:P-type Cu2+ transporter